MMNLAPFFGFLAAWVALGVLNTAYALATGLRERGWVAFSLAGGPLATSLFLVLSRTGPRTR